MNSTSVRSATVADLGYILDQQRKHRRELGFLPRQAVEEYEQRGHLWLAEENGEGCGFLAWGGFPGKRPRRNPFTLRIVQACIQYDAQRRRHGAELVRRLCGAARAGRYSEVSLWCADDLDATEFWHMMGFEEVAVRTGGSRYVKDRPHRRWVLQLGTGQLILPYPSGGVLAVAGVAPSVRKIG